MNYFDLRIRVRLVLLLASVYIHVVLLLENFCPPGKSDFSPVVDEFFPHSERVAPAAAAAAAAGASLGPAPQQQWVPAKKRF